MFANADGRLEVFILGPDRSVRRIRQQSPGGTWSDWASLGGYMQGEPGVFANADGRLEVFAPGMDGSLQHIWQTSPNGGWDDWASLGGKVFSRPHIHWGQDKRLVVTIRATDNTCESIQQDAPNSTWSAWTTLGSGLSSDAVLGRNADGHLDTFHISFSTETYNKRQPSRTAWAPGWNPLLGSLSSL
ncbi:hypothetical protein [Streptomyces sp. NPDC046862]|uniref:hypothetical protein n=1 Tax=Streptomyces sp. NPDC046862 TaxID=3154603 RepID=UPI003456F313